MSLRRIERFRSVANTDIELLTLVTFHEDAIINRVDIYDAHKFLVHQFEAGLVIGAVGDTDVVGDRIDKGLLELVARPAQPDICLSNTLFHNGGVVTYFPVSRLDYFTNPFLLVGEGRFSWRQSGVGLPRLEAFERSAGRWIAAYRTLAPQVGRSIPLLRRALGITQRHSYEEAAAAGERFASEFQIGRHSWSPVASNHGARAWRARTHGRRF